MAAIVDSQLSTFASKTKNLSSFNPFLPPDPVAVGVPIGIQKRQLSTNDSMSLGAELNFNLSKTDFISDIYAVITLTMNSSVAPPPAAAMAAISQVRLRSASGDICYYDYKPVMSHLGCRNGNEWMSTALKIAGDYSPSSANSVTGCAYIPLPWNPLVTQINGFSPLPTFLYDGSLQLTLTTEKAANLTTADTVTGISVSLITYGYQTIASLRQDLLGLPSYGWYSKDFQTIKNQAVTTSATDIDISRFTGTLRALSLKCQLDSTTASGTSNYWLLSDITDIQLQIGSDNVYQTYNSTANEVKMDTLIHGMYDGFSYASYVTGALELGMCWTLPLSGSSESMAVWSGGVVLSQITQSLITVTSSAASSHVDIIAEMLSFYNIQNKSIRRYL